MRKKTSYEFLTDQSITAFKFIDHYLKIDTAKKDWLRNDLFGFLFRAKPVTAKNYLAKDGGKPTALPHKNFKHFCNLIDGVCEQFPDKIRKEYDSFKEELTLIYSSITSDSTQKLRQRIASTKRNKSKHSAIISVKPHPFLSEIIQKSIWYTSEIVGNETSVRVEISKRVLTFKDVDEMGRCDFEVKSPHDDTVWKGKMHFIPGDNLLVGTCESIDETIHYTHFAIQIHDITPKLKICIGHKTFFSKQTGNVVTKTIIVEKQTEENTIPQIHSFDDETIDWKIRSFLFDRLRNRLTSPHSIKIFNHHTFSLWFDDNNDKMTVDESFIGSYQVMYKTKGAGGKTEIDYLKISKNMRGQLQAIYEERKQDRVLQYWTGIVEESTNALSISMKGPFKENKQIQKLPRLLILTIPQSGGMDINTLTGLIAGLRTDNKGGVARLIVIIKLVNNKPFEGFDMAVIDKYFEKFNANSRVRPPNDDIICNFEDLKTICS